MRHLVGIMTYTLTESLKLTIDLLKKDMDIVIHVDKKTDINPYIYI